MARAVKQKFQCMCKVSCVCYANHFSVPANSVLIMEKHLVVKIKFL